MYWHDFDIPHVNINPMDSSEPKLVYGELFYLENLVNCKMFLMFPCKVQ